RTSSARCSSVSSALDFRPLAPIFFLSQLFFSTVYGNDAASLRSPRIDGPMGGIPLPLAGRIKRLLRWKKVVRFALRCPQTPSRNTSANWVRDSVAPFDRVFRHE